MKSLLEREKERAVKAQEDQKKTLAREQRVSDVVQALSRNINEYCGRHGIRIEHIVKKAAVVVTKEATRDQLTVSVSENDTQQPQFALESVAGQPKQTHIAASVADRFKNQKLGQDEALDQILDWLKH